MKERISQFLQSLDPIQNRKVIDFWEKQNSVSIEQHPDWIAGTHKEYYLLEEEEEVKAFAVILLRKPIQVKIIFGPLAVNKEVFLESIKEIYKHYRKQVLWCGIQAPYTANDKIIEKLVTYLQQEGKWYSIDETLTWSTLLIDLKQDVVSIRKAFRQNHLRSITRAEKLGLVYSLSQNEQDATELAKVYVKMYQQRKLVVDQEAEVFYFKQALSFLQHTSKGFFITAFYNAQVVGGLLILYQGDTAFYAKGAVHPDYRELPIMHAAFERSIVKAKEEGMLFFDFGGYNLYAAEGSQLSSINHFKKGFGGRELSYQPFIYIISGCLQRYVFWFFQLYQQWKNR